MTDHPISPPPGLVASMIMQTFGPLGPTGLADEEELAKAFASFAAMAAEWGYQKHEKALLDAMHATELHPSLVVEPTSMSELSPQAQEVFWAFNRAASGKPEDWHYLPAIAAALRAAADHVVSPVPPPCEDFDEYAQGFLAAHVKYRSELLAIADELEGSND